MEVFLLFSFALPGEFNVNHKDIFTYLIYYFCNRNYGANILISFLLKISFLYTANFRAYFIYTSICKNKSKAKKWSDDQILGLENDSNF